MVVIVYGENRRGLQTTDVVVKRTTVIVLVNDHGPSLKSQNVTLENLTLRQSIET